MSARPRAQADSLLAQAQAQAPAAAVRTLAGSRRTPAGGSFIESLHSTHQLPEALISVDQASEGQLPGLKQLAATPSGIARLHPPPPPGLSSADDALAFFARCKAGLKPDGLIMVRQVHAWLGRAGTARLLCRARHARSPMAGGSERQLQLE